MTTYRRTLLFALILTGALFTTACGGDTDNSETTTCSSDSECKGDRVCEQGACVSPQSGNNTSNNTGNNQQTNQQMDATCAQACQNAGTLCQLDGGQCEANCSAQLTQAQRNCMASAKTCPDAEACIAGTGNNQTNNQTNNQNNGENGSTCNANEECKSGFCQTPPGAVEGTCKEHDFGNSCQGDSACMFDACLVRSGGGDDFGYCSRQCESFTDCPSFWSCEQLNNAAGKYCVQNN